MQKETRMSTIAEFMSTDHQACDEAFARAEEAALASDWSAAQTYFETFNRAMARHFRMEEEVLFPALLDANGPLGPVQVMRMEHEQMNDLIEQLSASLRNQNSKAYGGVSETLLIVMQQHNLKEEQILYPIADRLLATVLESLLTRLQLV